MSNQNIFDITHSTIDANAICNFISGIYDLPQPLRCELMTRGVNDIYLLKSKNTQYAVRILRSGSRNQDEINYEMDLTRYYHDCGFNAAIPIINKNGTFSSKIEAPEGKRYLTVFEWAHGEPLTNKMEIKNIKKLGIFVSEMHQISSDFATTKRVDANTSGFILKNLDCLIEILDGEPEEADFYEKLAHKACEEFDKIPKDQIAYGATHGDIHPHNVFITENGKMTLIDWDTCGDDFITKELTSFTWRSIYLNIPLEINDAYLEGYQSVRPFTVEEKELSELFFTMRHIYIMCGIAGMINVIGHNFVGYKHNLEKYKNIVRKPAKKAGLI